jgi:molecular chaperone DnaK (HSP70)
VEVVACGGDAAFGAANAEDDGLLDRLERVVRAVLVGAGLTPRAIDGLILGGGFAYHPKVRQRLSEGLGRTPPDDLDPGSAVAFGAALLGESGADGWHVRDLVPVDPAEPPPAQAPIPDETGTP